jgi:diguanylate cyclase (GGDEF)-like protein
MMGGEGRTQGGSAMDDDGLDGNVSVVDELTGLANRRGFMEILRLEERRHARYGGSPILVLIDARKVLAERPPAERGDLLVEIAAILADAIRDTDTLGRVDDDRFAILAIQAGCSASSIVGRLRLHLELRRIHQAEVTLGEPGAVTTTGEALEGPGRPALRLVR